MGNFCCVQVKESTLALKENCGKFQKKLEPGCHCVPWLLGQRIAGHVSVKTKQLDIRCDTITKDNVFVGVVTSIHYKVASTETAAYNAFYLLSDPEAQIQAHAFELIKMCISEKTLDELFGSKDIIANDVNEKLKAVISPYGYESVKTMIVDIAPEEHVIRAINMTNAASKIASAMTGATAKEVMEMLLVTQYYDTMKEIGATSKSSAVFMPHGTQFKEGLLQAPSQL